MADLLTVAAQEETCQSFLRAIADAELSEVFQNTDPLTLLVPTDTAFANFTAASNPAAENGQKLKRVLLYHVLFGDVRSDDLAQIEEAPTMEGSVVAIHHENGFKVNDAQVVKTDLVADNGVIHTIDRVLIPALLAGQG